MSETVVQAPPLVQAYVNQLEADRDECLAAGVELPPLAQVMDWCIREINTRGLVCNQLQADVLAQRNIIVNLAMGLTQILSVGDLDNAQAIAQALLDRLPKNGLNNQNNAENAPKA